MEKKKHKAVLIAFNLACFLLLIIFLPVLAQSDEQRSAAIFKAEQLFARLSPEEKVGQLFMVSMDRQDIGEESPIVNLIKDYHIGGIVLKRSNENFERIDDDLLSTYELISGLQNSEWQTRNTLIESNGETVIDDFIPLFIGISQPGDRYPFDQIISGLTAVPSQMAIGATWQPSLAYKTGLILGEELSALGINFYFGPSLDVLDIIYREGGDDLGVRTFGGDPFWVGEMGKAYIEGLHTGSGDKIAVIARNFPGRGSSDRLPEEEVATVRKSLEQMKLIELAPFYQATSFENDTLNVVADGLLLSHIRYQGFQGNIRATTKPVSFDQTAVDLLMNLPEFLPWRINGGILVSEDLGSDAVKKFFSPGDQSFDARQVARNAFLAGMDLLNMDQFISSGDGNRFETYRKVIDFFVQKYREDQAFAARVDASVKRILTLKYSIYPDFQIDKIIPSQAGLTEIGKQNSIAFEIASQAATLISPSLDQLSSNLPDGPQLGERIIIFTDTLEAAQCSECIPQSILAVDGLQEVIRRLYGSGGSGQISDNQIISYSFLELQDFLENPFNRVDLETNLSRSEWVVFIVQDMNSDRPAANALQDLLAENLSTIRNKKVIVFSLTAPYYFDATNISAFTAYYCLYSKLPSFIEVAARLLFQEITPVGSSPVSIPGVAYDLITVTSPKPDQIIELMVDQTGTPEEIVQEGEIDQTQKVFNLGDNLPVRTGMIVDHNDHPVPDGTVVKFNLNQQGENVTVQQIEATTKDGIAYASIKLASTGMHEIRVTSEPAMNSQILLLNISAEEGAQISAITPTPMPTIEEQITPESSLPDEEQTDQSVERKINNHLLEWFLSSMFVWGGGATFWYLSGNIKSMKMRMILSAGFILGGVISGTWQILGLPGSHERFGMAGFFDLFFFTIIGSATGVLFSYYFFKQKQKQLLP